MDKITIVKIGGKIINEEELLRDFLWQFAKIHGLKILVHGGGRSASQMLSSLGIEARMHNGRRITDSATLDVCVGQYAGRINKKIVSLLQTIDVDALGLSGADGGIIKAKKRPDEPFDYGFAGDIVRVKSNRILGLLKLGFVPVFCAITANQNGQLLNTNADTIAASLAVSLIGKAEVDLRFCFEFDGVLEDLESDRIIKTIKSQEFESLVDQSILTGGILPKVQNAITAKKNGVGNVAICGSSNLVDLINATQIV